MLSGDLARQALKLCHAEVLQRDDGPGRLISIDPHRSLASNIHLKKPRVRPRPIMIPIGGQDVRQRAAFKEERGDVDAHFGAYGPPHRRDLRPRRSWRMTFRSVPTPSSKAPSASASRDDHRVPRLPLRAAGDGPREFRRPRRRAGQGPAAQGVSRRTHDAPWIGDGNVFREHVTIHRGTVAGGGETRIGHRNMSS